ncbi:xylulokinase [Leucobacter sp. HNU]|uniref:xylulokinase n=1 Tax=Leucobacter sp. HNU TaxID=3236805 RepID=UPI003A809250
MVHEGAIAIGLDLGTSSAKALAVEVATGRVLARVRRPYPTSRPEAGAAEQAPGDWMAAVVGALGELAQSTPAQRWIGIGLSAMLPTLVCLDAAGEPVGPAVVWEDIRAETDARELAAQHPDATAYARTGQHLDGRYLVPMYRRIARTDPGAARRIARIAGAKDYVFARLTGVLLTDPSTAVGSGVSAVADGAHASGDWPELPEVRPSTETRGLVDGVARLVGVPSGIPVALGAADSVLGAVALGARPGRDVAIISGTSTVILGTRRSPEPDPGGRSLVTPLASDGFGWEMDLVATGSAFAWLAGLTGAPSVEALLAEAVETDPGSAPLVLPYLGPGEQGALWETGLFGGFTRLTLGSTRGDLMRGLVTGIVLEARRCIAVIDPPEDGRLLVAGSSARSPMLLQDLADACGRPVEADLVETDHSALGAADLVSTACGSAPIGRTHGAPHRFDPRSERAALWRELAERQEAALRRERARVAGGQR